jgi:hypothetical protein
MWEAEAILDEDPGKKKFLLKWAGVDPHTGEPWAHSWEDKNGVTQNLIDEWKAKKKRDPLLVGKFRREEDQRRKAAHAAGAAKARAAKEGQVRKRKRTAESARSNESPKKTRREGERANCVQLNLAHDDSRQTGIRRFKRLFCHQEGDVTSAEARREDGSNRFAD